MNSALTSLPNEKERKKYLTQYEKIARIFGSDLKAEYNRSEKDKTVERIII